jgi:glutaredoxin
MLTYYHIYAKAECPYCVKAINLMNELGYEFVLTLVDASPEYYYKLKKKYEHDTVPMIVEYDVAGHEKFIGGYSELIEYFADYTDATENTKEPTSVSE